MSENITNIAISSNPAEEKQLEEGGYQRVPNDDPKSDVKIWYKKAKKEAPITRLQVSFNDAMSEGLGKAGYHLMKVPITSPEGPVFLWYFVGTGSYDIPIVEMSYFKTPEKAAEMIWEGWEKVGCSLTPVDGLNQYLWIKRAKTTCICDITATNFYDKDAELFQAGYNRIDETTNSPNKSYKGNNFLWYRLTTEFSNALGYPFISTNTKEYDQFLKQGYTLVDVNLNNGTGGRTVYVFYKKTGGSFIEPPLVNMMLLLQKSDIAIVEKAGMNVIEENINEGNRGAPRYLCYPLLMMEK